MVYKKILNKFVLFSLTYTKQICYIHFVITNLQEDNKMAIGKRIRYIRKLKGMTQKQLGMLIGLSERTADIRMAQYENGTRTPKEDMVNAIAQQLDVSPAALNIPDTDTYIGIIHTLFDLEDNFNFRVELVNNEIHLAFENNSSLFSIHSLLYGWALEQEKYRKGLITKEEYDNWRYNFPKFDKTQDWAETISPELNESLV